MQVLDPTEHVAQYGSGVRPNDSDDGDSDSDTSDDNDFIPTIRILNERTRHFRNLGVDRISLQFQFLNPPERENMDVRIFNRVLRNWLYRAFYTMLEMSASRLSIRPTDKVGISFSRRNNDSFNFSFKQFNQYSPEHIIQHLSKLIQSNTEFLFDENLHIEVTKIRSDVGLGRKYRLEGHSIEKFAATHNRSVHLIKPLPGRQTMCLAYALVLGIAHAQGNKNHFIRLTYPPNVDIFTEESLALCQKANVDLSYGGGIEELRQFQNYFGKEFNIIVFNDRKGRSLFYRGHTEDEIKKIYLLLEDEHYLLITSTHAAFSVNYFCDLCLKASRDRICHRDCPYTCLQCYSRPPCKRIEQGMIYCCDCNRNFYGRNCYLKHCAEGICLKYKTCKECCLSYYNRDETIDRHVCGESYCVKCKCVKPTTHDCYIPCASIHLEENEEEDSCGNLVKKVGPIFVFFDFETVQDELLPGEFDKFEHKVHLAVAQNVCNECKDNENIDEDCAICGKRQHIFLGENSLHMFMEYLVHTINKECKKVICIAHNMRGYDGQFCLRYMYKNNNKWNLNTNSVIICGTKIMSIRVGRYIFLDSINYLCSPLSKLPQMFNIEHKKGYFPHFFHTIDNMGYIGQYPDPKYYSADTMNEKDRDQFLEWHSEKINSNAVFSLKDELIEYCKIDVDILRKACMRFRTLLLDNTQVDPFDGPITIASTCMKVFRTNYLKPDTISIVPWNGYRRIDNQSIKASQWLYWMSHKNNIQIQMAENGREFRLPINIKVDGYCAETNTVYEFLGKLFFFSFLY